MSRLVVGDVRHAGHRQGFYRPGDLVDAYIGNTMFVTDACEVDDAFHDADYQHRLRSLLKRVGNFTLQIDAIERLHDGGRIATLAPVDEHKESMRSLLEATIFSDYVSSPVELQDPPIMTMTSRTALEVGNTLSLSYLTLLEPRGAGLYTLRHDYALNFQEGPRHEWYE